MIRKKNIFDAEIFSENSSEEIKSDTIKDSILPDSGAGKSKRLKGKKDSYREVLEYSFNKEDKNNISPVNIYTSIQSKISFLKILHPKMSKIDIVNTILKDFFDKHADELNSEMAQYQANLNSIF